MLKKIMAVLIAMVMVFAFSACGSESTSSGLEDGTYKVTFTTDNPGMFHVNESLNDEAVLTVVNGEMTVHVTLQSKHIVNLYPGTSEDAQKEGAELLQPTEDEVTYSDGYKDTAYGFDIPVPVLDEEFDLALIGTKGSWYDHKVVVSSPIEKIADAKTWDLADGEYEINVDLMGGSGRATVESPAPLKVAGGEATLTLTFSSPYYDYVIIGDETYYPVNEEGNSTFEIPVPHLDEEFAITADTTAMSEAHEIDYTLKCYK